MKIPILPLVILLSVLACQHDRRSRTGLGSEARDSAGIRIIENARPPDGSRLPWRIGPEPTVSIGAREGEEPYLLYLVRDATMLSDGRILVANGGTGEIRVFDASGTHEATWGGEGEGPGEFGNLWQLEPWPGDSIVAWFAPGMGISVFDAHGSFSRTFTLAADSGTPPWLRFSPLATTSDGSVLSVQTEDTVVVRISDGEGGTRSSLGSRDGWETYIANEGTGREIRIARIFGGRPVWERWGDLVVIATTSRYALRAFNRDGTLARIVRRGHEPRAPTEAEIEAEIEERPGFAGMEPGQSRGLYRSSVAEHFPAFASVKSDVVDHLWVEEYEVAGEERPGSLWTVFDPGGRVLGFVETPVGFVVFEIGEDYILGRFKDDLGVEYVQVWPLDRSGG